MIQTNKKIANFHCSREKSFLLKYLFIWWNACTIKMIFFNKKHCFSFFDQYIHIKNCKGIKKLFHFQSSYCLFVHKGINSLKKHIIYLFYGIFQITASRFACFPSTCRWFLFYFLKYTFLPPKMDLFSIDFFLLIILNSNNRYKTRKKKMWKSVF